MFPAFSFPSNPQLTWAPLIQAAGLILAVYFVFKSNSSPYAFCFIWLVTIGASSLMIFKEF